MKAFPSKELVYEDVTGRKKVSPGHPGMDLIDYFAAKALEGYLSCKGWHPDFNMKFDKEYAKDGIAHEVVTDVCYKWADAMMKAREQ